MVESKIKDQNPVFENKKLLLIIGGGISAYKTQNLIRLLKKEGAEFQTILTKSGQEFITPLSIAALSGIPPHQDLFSPQAETQMGHIALSRQCDLIIIAPATADLIAKMALGLASDLASTTLLAADKPILCAPAMNPKMWSHPATQTHIETLKKRGVLFSGPQFGDMACGETGNGRMTQAEDLLIEINAFFSSQHHLKNKKVILTAGPTYEPIDPVRFIGNRSSGKQGYAIAEALSIMGANVTLISGPVSLPTPYKTNIISVETTQEMYEATLSSLPADIAICTAAVCDWKPNNPVQKKLKKGIDQPNFSFSENPDILKTLSQHKNRPNLVIGFAAETDNVIEYATQKYNRKKCDWIFANNISKNHMGSDQNKVSLINQSGCEEWSVLSKKEIGFKIAQRITAFFKNQI